MRVAVTGSRGLIGGALVSALEADEHVVHRLIRGSDVAEYPDLKWDPVSGAMDFDALDGVDAVVHLAGESIAGRRWSPKQKTAIVTSRVQGTRRLAEGLAALVRKPTVLISASAVGYYGDGGDELLDEDSPSGETFLAATARSWEDAARPAVEAGIRVVHPRIGIVLTTKGGALAKMLPPFRLGLGGRIGSGNQWMSWIALADLIRVVRFLLTADGLNGPVNAVSPNPATNREFTRSLGRALGRPTVVPVPAFAIELLFGEMGAELLLQGQRVAPRKLLEAGFEFELPNLDTALPQVLASAN